MTTTVDGEGRVRIPDELRSLLGLDPGSEVDVRLGDGCVELVPLPGARRLVPVGGRTASPPSDEIPRITVDDVRDLLERIRR